MWTIATFNVNSIRKRISLVSEWLAIHQPDVLCLQETKVQDSEFPTQALAPSGYQWVFRGMKAYNGVAILSRELPGDVSFGLQDGKEPDEFRLIQATVNGLTIVNTYVPQGSAINSPKYAYKLDWFKRLRVYFQNLGVPDKPVVWLGDMNVAPTPIDVHHPESHEDHVCYHVDARTAYHTVMELGFEDVYRRLHPATRQYTFWDFRMPRALERNLGWRIDHILATPSVASYCEQAGVDLNARKHPEPSDHTIVWARFRD